MNIDLLQDLTASLVLLCFYSLRYTWSLLMGKRKKVLQVSWLNSGRHAIQFVIYFLVPILLIFNIFNIKVLTQIISSQNFLYILGTLYSCIGLVFIFFTRFHRASDWGYMGDQVGEKLFTGGVYKITRHPYYFGAISFGIGIYMIMNSYLVVLMIVTILFVKKVIKREEKFLFEKFGEEWVNYKNKVRF